MVVLGIDSLSWQFVDPLLEAGELPHLQALVDRGWGAALQTVEPTISPPNWTSIATGHLPERHGIQTFFTTRHQIREPAVWERLAAAGVRVGVYDYMLTWPPRPLPGGFVLPGWLRRDERVEPPDLAERLGRMPHRYTVLDMGGLEDTVAEMDRELRLKAGDFVDLMEAFELDVGFVTFYAVDVISHRFFHTYAPQAFDPPIPYAPHHEGLLDDTIRRIDEAVGTLVEALDEHDHIVLISDHGAQASDPVPRLWGFGTRWMMERTGLGAEQGVTMVNGFIRAAFRVAGPEAEASAVVASLTDFASNIHTLEGEPLFEVQVVNDPASALEAPDASGLSPLATEVIAPNLPAHAFVFLSIVPEVVERLWPAGEVLVGDQRLPLSDLIQAHDFTGIHHPTAFFLADGPAFPRGQPRGELSVIDIAPLVLYLAGQPIPDDLPGQSPDHWLATSYLERFPVTTIPADEAPVLPPEEGVEVEGESDEEVKKRLRALGYLQ